MGTNNVFSANNKQINYSSISVVKDHCSKKEVSLKSNLQRVTSFQIKNGRSQAYKHLIL